MHITTLMDDSPGKTGLTNQHGLSLHIETSGTKILFDAGPSNAVSSNARVLGKRLSDVDLAILSHGHYDHSGGLDAFFNENLTARLYVRKGADGEYYAKRKDGFEYIGVEKKMFERNAKRIVEIDLDFEICQGVHALVSIPHIESLPAGNGLLFKKEGDVYVNDLFDHELVSVIEEDDGIVILSGCGHSGIINMVLAARKRFQNQRIKAVIGGLHLMYGSSSQDFAQNTHDASVVADRLLQLGCEKIISGHCTGHQATAVLKDRLEGMHTALFTGLEIDL
jgi:7,8-dihydropterin-6-yl-methyl-4-(beta-D-ribofuranosyl)aminobenzene 5'-phosphate synthase